ncbi:plasmid partitioning protein RepB C-terminal domain-containing protein [Rhizobium sp. BE258]|uniref:plasmid partitioning protein RepB C-terminal domain-containing protein n=1 Tax=Rhizobium sp. BE258 TaxID=2817722 RepID=UPI002855C8B3|nr:plasmid partitioning protein RepB C-terminal domain-containing protein [Rhizobium sp. BE258]MDR7145156.1 hypothetical protein [Rhizobium sp. BE258]
MSVKRAFQDKCELLPLTAIRPMRELPEVFLRSRKYLRIECSVRAIGLVEPIVVIRDVQEPEYYNLLDGHVRLHALQKIGIERVLCLHAKDDEAFTFNSQISRLAAIQEHRMILKAVACGVSEQRIAEVLNVNVQNIKNKLSLLKGIAPEVATLLNDRQVPFHTVRALKKLKPVRQLQVAQLMIAMDRFSVSYCRSLVEATPVHLLVSPGMKRAKLLPEQISMMAMETENLERDFKAIESDFGRDHLELVVISGYLRQLLNNAAFVGELARHYPDILREFQALTCRETDPLIGAVDQTTFTPDGCDADRTAGPLKAAVVHVSS